MFRPVFVSCLVTALVLLCVAPAPAAPQHGLNKNKLIHAEKIIEPFEQGQQATKVTVNLAQPWDILKNTNWRSHKSLSALRKEIHGRQQQVLETLSTNELHLRHRYENQTGFSAEVSLAGLEKLSNDPRVESIEPIFQLEAHVAQGIDLMNALATRSTYNGQGIAIAICDTGIDYNHPAMGGGGFPNAKVIGGYDTGDNDSNPIPNGQAHGTCCAGIAAGDVASVGDYIGGVAYGAKLYALKISFGTTGSAYNDDMAAAWDWCITHQNDDPANPIMVISTSFGGGRYFGSCDSAYASMTIAANNAVAAGITLLVSSGNDGYCDSIGWPACISSVISVGAVYDASFGTYLPCISADSCAPKTFTTGCSTNYYATDSTAADKVTSYSNTAPFLDLLAPSNRAYTTDISGASGYSSSDYYSSFGGTSAACPYAAGVVAALQSASKAITGDYFTPDEIRNLLTSTGDDVTDSKVAITKPRVNLGSAMEIFGGPSGSPPIAQNAGVTTQSDTPVTITLDATDDGLPDPPATMTYIITSLLSNGQLSDPGNGIISSVPYSLVSYGNQVIYTPDVSFDGFDSFQFKANDGGIAPDGGDSNTATVSIDVATAPQLIYSADMDTNPGWTYDGDWAWGTPTGDGGGNGYPDPTSGFTGSNIVGYKLSGNYAQISSTEWAKTPAIDCTARTDITLSFYRWLNVDSPTAPPQGDHAFIEVSNDGSVWNRIWQNDTKITDSSWIPQTFDISAMADNQSTVFIRWGMGETNRKDHYSGWNIDDVEVNGNLVLPQRTLTTSSTSGGVVSTPGEGAYQYNHGTVVGITATQDLHYHFVDWTGTGVTAGKVANPNAADTNITMNDDYTVQANFAIDTYTLDYTAGSGGSTTGDTSQVVDYGGDGTAVTAVPNTGSHFVKWSDDVMTASRTDTNVTADIDVTAAFAVNPVVISGVVTEPDPSSPVEGVLISSGSDPNTVTDPNGLYSLVVDYGWSGILTPVKTGYTFEPNSITYTNTIGDPNADYVAMLDTFTISGHALDSETLTPLEGVLISPDNDGGPFTSKYYGGSDVTDANGFYKVLVDYDFSGDVAPSKYAYAFEPNGIFYANITEDLAADQNYIGTFLTYTITGYVTNPCDLPIEGVVVDANNGGSSDITDPNGFYEVWVDYNWSGTVTPSKNLYTFDPNMITYKDVLGEQFNQAYSATNIYDLDCDGSIGLGDFAIMCNHWLETGPDVPGDFYKDEDDILNFLDFAVFANVWGD